MSGLLALIGEGSGCRKIRDNPQHGANKEKTQTSKPEHYKVDVIISVGYCVIARETLS